MENERKRFIDIDFAKGLAIILVVLGHVVARNFPEGNAWFIPVKTTIYMFHMAFFMFLSGWIFYYTKPQTINVSTLYSFINKRAFRLLLPFVLMAILVLTGKSFASGFFLVDNSVYSLSEAIRSIVWDTAHSKVTFIWYIYVLFVFNVFTIIFIKLFNKDNLIPLLIASFALTFIKVPQVLYLDFIFKYYFYFILGCWAVTKHEEYYNFIKSKKNYILSAFILSILIANTHFVFPKISLLISLFAIPSLHYLVQTDFAAAKLNFLGFLGKYSLTIYLFNVIFIGLIKGIMFKFFSWDNSNFFVYLPVLFLSGLLLPIALRTVFLAKIPIINKITI